MGGEAPSREETAGQITGELKDGLRNNPPPGIPSMIVF